MNDLAFKTEGGIEVVTPPDLTVEFDDPGTPQLRTKQFNEIAAGMFELNGIKRHTAVCDGKKCVLMGWGG